MTTGWFKAYAGEFGHQLPQRVMVPGYKKGPVWAPSKITRSPSLVDAEDLAGRGLFVFPLKPGAKEPATKHGFHDASRNPYQLEAWWSDNCRENIGIATGAKSGVLVIDLDGDVGIASFARYVALGLPPTWCALTAGGAHLYFAHPGNIELPNSQNRLGQNIDTRGDGGYAVAPPSLLASGVSYRWLCAPWELEEPAMLPPWMLEAWRPTRTVQPSRFEIHRSFLAGEDGDPRALAKLDKWAREIAAAPKGTRDSLVAKYSFAAGVRAREGKLTRSAAERMLLGAVAAWGPVSRRDHAKVTKGIAAGYGG